jgi:localization factor PodJL
MWVPVLYVGEETAARDEMRPDLPWSVAGISAEAREAARAAARREGLSVGEWLTRRIVSELAEMNESRSQWSLRSEPRPAPERQRFQSDEMLDHVSRSEAETAEVYRRIEDQLRGMARRLDASERSQSENSRVMSKAAVEMNITAREQAQAFDQIGAHVADLADRLEKVELRDTGEGMRDAVKALHQGLSRLADQMTETANQSAAQISNLASNLETVAGRVTQARQDAMAASQTLETRLGTIDERVRAVEAASQTHASTIDRALMAIEDQKRLPSPMEAVHRLEDRLEDGLRRMDERGPDPSVDRRLSGVERTMSDLIDRIETRDDTSQTLEETLKKLLTRVENLETSQRDAAAELRKAAQAAATMKAMEPPPVAPPPPVVPPVVMPEPPTAAGFSPLSNFEPPPFATEPPPFAAAPEPFPAASPFAAEVPADAFALPPDPAGDLDAALAPEAPASVQSYLAAARRSARAAAEQENERNASLGALRWGTNTEKPAEEAPKKKSNPLLVVLLTVVIVVVSAALFLRWQAANNHPATPPVATAAATPAKAQAKPELHQSASDDEPLPPQEARPIKHVQSAAAAPVPPAAQPQQTAPQQPAPAAAPLDRLTQAANGGNARAQLIVGLKYLEGAGVPANLTEAAKWLTKAADAGEPVAQYRLGGMYENGRGVAKDPVKAVRLYLAAANQGNGKAMHNLAVAYAEGTGVKKDFAEASRWFLKAANLGVSDSQFNLAVLYEHGYGVPQNQIDAYKWYAIAAAGGDAESKNRMATIGSQLDGEARAAAQHAADSFRAAPLNARANVAPTIADATRG